MSQKDEQDKSNTGESQSDNSQVNDSDKNGQSDNSGSQNENKDQNNSEEESFKKRYADSSKEAQRLAAVAKKYEEKYGKLEDEESDDQNTDKSGGEEKEDEKKGQEQEEAGKEDEKIDLSDIEENPIRVKGVSEQTAIDLVWDRFVEQNAEVLKMKPELMQEVASEFHRFTKDGAGNDIPYKSALKNAFKYVYSDVILEREKKKAADQALINAAKSGEGRMDTDSSRSSNSSSGVQLTPAEKKTAQAMGITEEVYAKRKSENTNQ